MPKVEIYTGMMCGFCYRAKELFNKKNISFKEIDVSMDVAKRNEMRTRSGGRSTVPQIFIDSKHIGGCDELYRLEHNGQLDGLLKS